MAIFRDFSKKIFRTIGLQLKLLILIESPNIFHWKPAKKTKKKKEKKLGVVLEQNLDQTRSNVLKKSKETGIINGFFSYFAQGIHFKARSNGCTNT